MTRSRERLDSCPFCGSDDVQVDCYSRDADGVCIEPAVNCNGCELIALFDFEAQGAVGRTHAPLERPHPRSKAMSESEKVERCRKCDGTGWWVSVRKNQLTGGPCDCLDGIRARPALLTRLRARSDQHGRD